MTVEELTAEARAVAELAYAPYSQFRVGAIVVDDDGVHHSGANVENAAYGTTTCAEATAITGAVARGVRKIDTVAVACIDALTENPAVMPGIFQGLLWRRFLPSPAKYFLAPGWHTVVLGAPVRDAGAAQ